MGIGTITDSLAAMRKVVYEDGLQTLPAIVSAMEADYEGHEALRQRLLHRSPKYGNDDDEADDVMRDVFETYFAAVDGRPNTKGGTYRVNLLPTTVHVYFGSVVQALPDGRKAGVPLSEGISPVQGMDRNGPTAVYLHHLTSVLVGMTTWGLFVCVAMRLSTHLWAFSLHMCAYKQK